MILGLVPASKMELMKVLVILMKTAKILFFVDTKIAQQHLPMTVLIVVVEINLRVQIIQIVFSAMLKKLGS